MYNKILIVFLAVTVSLVAGDYQFPQIAGWETEDTVAVYDASNLWERIDGAADLFLNYNFQQLYAVDLLKDKIALALEIYDMGTPLNAFGIYNTEAPYNKKKLNIGAEACLSPPMQGFFLKGKYYVKIDVFEGKISENDEIEIFKAVDAALAGHRSLPAEIELLPKYYIHGSVSYVKSSFQGLGELQNCLTAEYESSDGKRFKYFIVIDEISFVKSLPKNWKTIEHNGHVVYFRQIPYKGFIGLSIIDGKILGVTDSNTRELMLKRFDALIPIKE